MLLKEACEILLDIEKNEDVNSLKINNIHAWPLIRQCLWYQLISNIKVQDKQPRSSNYILLNIKSILRNIKCLANKIKYKYIYGDKTEILFLSRPVYLQQLNKSNEEYDRIIDPIIQIVENEHSYKKYYLGKSIANIKLAYAGKNIKIINCQNKFEISSDHIKRIDIILNQFNLDKQEFYQNYNNNLIFFLNSYSRAQDLYKKHPSIKQVFLTSWYFPDMMGFIAFFKKKGIKTTDIQHGKQGKYQGMYSWWSVIPEKGYEMLPDTFWCWGKPSCDHILTSSENRSTHLPIPGGFPWMDYFKKNISDHLVKDNVALGQSKKNVLITLQPPQGNNDESIPEFLLEYLRGITEKDSVKVKFRCHPNHIGCKDYCLSRLSDIPESIYSISSNDQNLYDEILRSTHHITAYSSCCYEAYELGVPTLLYGDEALLTYSDEINSGLFAWTKGDVNDLSIWLTTERREDIPVYKFDRYIISDMDYSKKIMSDHYNL